MTNVGKFLLLSSLWIVTSFTAAVLYTQCQGGENDNTKIIKDTLIVHDTIRYSYPVPKDSCITKYITTYLPVSSPNDTVLLDIEKHDTIVIKDSVKVNIPITSKVYQDSTYRAWVSGYSARLDSIEIYRKTININSIQYKKYKWGIGIQTGIGVNTHAESYPYIGIGIQYNIFSW